MKFPSLEWLSFDAAAMAAMPEEQKSTGFGFDESVHFNRLGAVLALALMLLAAAGGAMAQSTEPETAVVGSADRVAGEDEPAAPDLPDAPVPVRFQIER